jgi:hypothetical protein
MQKVRTAGWITHTEMHVYYQHYCIALCRKRLTGRKFSDVVGGGQDVRLLCFDVELPHTTGMTGDLPWFNLPIARCGSNNHFPGTIGTPDWRFLCA